MSALQGEKISELLAAKSLPWNRASQGGATMWSPSSDGILLRDGLRVTVLSPRAADLASLAPYWKRELAAHRPPTKSSNRRLAEPAIEQAGVPERRGVLMLHARADESWARRFRERAKKLSGDREPWSSGNDGAIAGAEWAAELQEALANARVAVVLASPAAFASSHLTKGELPALQAAAKEGLLVTWILITRCNWRDTPLAQFQAVRGFDTPLDSLDSKDREAAIDEIVRVLDSQDGTSAASKPAQRSDDDGFDLAALASGRFVSDKSVVNAASIAFLAEFHDRSLLIGGDAQADVLRESIQALLTRRKKSRLRVDAFVVPHAGSARNLSRELLELLECDRYLISTDGSAFRHPDRATVARIIMYGRASPDSRPSLVFNYRTPFTEIWADPSLQERYQYEAVYPEVGAAGIKVHI